MKNSLRNSKLWQQKRNELKVTANADEDWGDMSKLLDQHLPVAPKGNAPGGDGGASGLSNFGGIAGIGGISVVLIAITVYLVAHFSGNKPEKPGKDSIGTKQQTELVSKQDSVNKSTDSIAKYSQAVKDSSLVVENTKIDKLETEPSVNPATDNKNPAGSKASLGNPVPAKSGLGNGSTKSGSGSLSIVNTGTANSGPSKAAVNNMKAGKANTAPSNSGLTGGSVLNRNSIVSNSGKSSIVLNNSGRNGITPNNTFAKGGQGRSHGGYNANGKSGNAGRRVGPNGKLNQSQANAHLNGRGNRRLQSNADKDDLNSQVINQKDTIATDAYDPFLPFKQTARLNGEFNNRTTISESAATIASPKTAADILNGKGKKDKKPKPSSAGNSKLDYGILGGANISSGFGLYGGVYGAYHITDKFGLNLQVTGLGTQNISGGYSHANGSKVDSGKVIQVTDSRKAYFVNVPLHATYNIADNFSVKAGPVLSIPVKQTNGVTSLTPTTINKDSAYYAKTISQLNTTRYNQQINLGVSGGLRYQYNRYSVEATYLKSLSSFSVTSDYGTYKTNGAGVFQIILGIQLNR